MNNLPKDIAEESKHILTYGNNAKNHHYFVWSSGLWCGGNQKMFGSTPKSMALLGWRYVGPVAPESEDKP